MSIKTFIRSGVAVSALAASLLGSVDPAAAAHLGSGLASGTEDQLDAGDPPTNGTIDVVGTPPNTGPVGACGLVKDDQFVDPVTGTDADSLSAKYTLNSDGTFTFASGQVDGITIVVETSEEFYFGPQGTHFGLTTLGNNCGAENLGQLAPVPATITVTDGTASCSGTGGFWREGGDVFGVDATFSATTAGCVDSTLTFAGIFQPPCGFPNPVDCINGAYTQH